MKPNFLRFAMIAALGAGMAFAQAPAASAQPGAAKPGMHCPMARRQAMRHRWIKELNMTPAQQQQAKTFFRQARESTKTDRLALRENRRLLAQAVKTGNTAKINQLSSEEGHLIGKVIDARTEAMAKVYNILTPAQRAKAEQLHKQFRERMHQRWEKRNS